MTEIFKSVRETPTLLIEVHDLLQTEARSFAHTAQVLRTLEAVAVTVAQKEPALLVGETGTGKSTLVQQIASQVSQSSPNYCDTDSNIATIASDRLCRANAPGRGCGNGSGNDDKLFQSLADHSVMNKRLQFSEPKIQKRQSRVYRHHSSHLRAGCL